MKTEIAWKRASAVGFIGLFAVLLVSLGIVGFMSFREEPLVSKSLSRALYPDVPSRQRIGMHGHYGNDELDLILVQPERVAAFERAGLPGLQRLLYESRLPESRWARWKTQFYTLVQSKVKYVKMPDLWMRKPEARARFAIGVLKAMPTLPEEALTLLLPELKHAAIPERLDDLFHPDDPSSLREQRISTLVQSVGRCGPLGRQELTNLMLSASVPFLRLTAARTIRSSATNLTHADLFIPALRTASSKGDLDVAQAARSALLAFAQWDRLQTPIPGPVRWKPSIDVRNSSWDPTQSLLDQGGTTHAE